MAAVVVGCWAGTFLPAKHDLLTFFLFRNTIIPSHLELVFRQSSGVHN